MLWPLICVINQETLGRWGFEWQNRMALSLVFSLCCIIGDVLLLTASLTRTWKPQCVLTWLHMIAYVLMWVLHFPCSSWIATRPVLILMSFWVCHVYTLSNLQRMNPVLYTPCDVAHRDVKGFALHPGQCTERSCVRNGSTYRVSASNSNGAGAGGGARSGVGAEGPNTLCARLSCTQRHLHTRPGLFSG